MRWCVVACCAAVVLTSVVGSGAATDWPGERPPSADSAATTESALAILDRIRQSAAPQDALPPTLTTSTESVLHLLNKWRQMLTTPRPKPRPTAAPPTAPPTTAVIDTTVPISEDSEATSIPETSTQDIVFETTTGEDVALPIPTTQVPVTEVTRSSSQPPRTVTARVASTGASNASPVDSSAGRNSTSASSVDVVATDSGPATWAGRTEIAAIAASCVVLLLLLLSGAVLTVFCCRRKFSRRNIYTTMWTTASTPNSALRGLTRPGPPVILKHEMLQQKYKPKKSTTMPVFAERKL